MERPGKKTCSNCGETGHNMRTCPHRTIEDTSIRYIEESITVDPKREILIKQLLDREAYEIEPDIFTIWIHANRPCQLKEVKYVMDRGLSKDSITIYLQVLNEIDTLY